MEGDDLRGGRCGGVGEDQHVGELLPGLLEGAGHRDPAHRVGPLGAERRLVHLGGENGHHARVPVRVGCCGRVRRPGAVVICHDNQFSLMFFGPHGLDAEGIVGPAERSRLVRPVSCRGPLRGGMARTDGHGSGGGSTILGVARLGPGEQFTGQGWVRGRSTRCRSGSNQTTGQGDDPVVVADAPLDDTVAVWMGHQVLDGTGHDGQHHEHR